MKALKLMLMLLCIFLTVATASAELKINGADMLGVEMGVDTNIYTLITLVEEAQFEAFGGYLYKDGVILSKVNAPNWVFNQNLTNDTQRYSVSYTFFEGSNLPNRCNLTTQQDSYSKILVYFQGIDFPPSPSCNFYFEIDWDELNDFRAGIQDNNILTSYVPFRGVEVKRTVTSNSINYQVYNDFGVSFTDVPYDIYNPDEYMLGTMNVPAGSSSFSEVYPTIELTKISPADYSLISDSVIHFDFNITFTGNAQPYCTLTREGTVLNDTFPTQGSNTLSYTTGNQVTNSTYSINCISWAYNEQIDYEHIIVDTIPGSATTTYFQGGAIIQYSPVMVYHNATEDRLRLVFSKSGLSFKNVTVTFDGDVIHQSTSSSELNYYFSPEDLEEDKIYQVNVTICDLVRCNTFNAYEIYKPKVEYAHPEVVLQGQMITFYINLTYLNNYGSTPAHPHFNWTLDKFSPAAGGDWMAPRFIYDNKTYRFNIDEIITVNNRLKFVMSKSVLSSELDPDVEVETKNFNIPKDTLTPYFRMSNCLYCNRFSDPLTDIHFVNSFNVTVLPSGIDDCSTYEHHLLTFISEKENYNNSNNLNFSLNIDFKFLTSDGDLDQSFAFRDNNTYSICVESPGEYRYSFVSEYFADGFSKRSYYADDLVTQTDVNETITLFLLESDKSTTVMYRVFDKFTLDPKRSVYVKTYRYYPELATYKLVEVSKTNSNGETSANIELFNAFYRFVLEKPMGTLLPFEGQEPTRVLSNIKTFPVTISAIDLNEWYELQDAIFNVNCNPNTGVCSMTWTSTTDKEGKITVVKRTGQSRVVVGTATESASGATIFVEIEELQNGSIYEATGELITASGDKRVQVDSINLAGRLFFTTEEAQQYMIPMIMAIVMIIFLLINFGPIGVILGSTFAFAVGAFLYLIPLPTYMVAGSGVFGIITLAFIIIYKISK